MDYFAKKQWIRIAVCAVLVAVAVLAMTGVFSGGESLVYDPAAKNLPAGAVTAEASEQGFGGEVTVHATVEDNKISELTIDTPNETEGLGKRASDPAFTDQFIGKSGPFTFGEDGIEALSGATVTSNAALKAINRAVGGEASPEAEPETAPAAEPPEEKQADEKQEAASDGQEYDVYTATSKNNFSTVTVTAYAKDGKLTDVQISSEGEAGMDLLTDEIRTGWAKAILESGSASPDAITGATLTFSAASVQEAMTEILEKMNGEAAAPEAEPETEPAAEPAEEKTEEPAEEKQEEPAAQTETKQEASSNGQAYGVYRATSKNDFSTITVIASAKNGQLTDVKIQSEGAEGMDLLTDEIKAEWAKAILESGSASPDAITGATLKFSAASVQEAMTEILANMNGEIAAPEAEPAEEPAEEKKEEHAAQTEEKQEASSSGQAYGVYRATSKNDFSTITVIASAKNGQLTDVKIQSEGAEGMDLLTDEIKAEWAKAILESGSASPDTITGATLKFSAASVQEAMTEILANMNGEETAPEAAEEPVAEETAAEEKPAEEPAAEEPAAEETPAEEPAAEAPAAEEPAAEKPAKTYPAYAGYRADAENTFSRITVIAYVKSGKLTDVKILSEGDDGKDLLTDEIRTEWAKAILESGSASPDAITGATLQFSAASVQEAMTEILTEMDGGTAAPEAAPAEPAEETVSPAESGDNILPQIVLSMGREEENSYVTDYLEQDPYLVNIYEGYGFAKDYGSARGHYYTLTDVDKTQRPHANANCLTCKTPDMHKMIGEQGVSVYSMPYDEVRTQITQPISCYTCHGADDGNGGSLVVTHQYVNEALGDNVSEVKAASLSCGQCHIEYYFTPADKETMMPYHSMAEMTPERILAYYDELGFYDWEQPGTGTQMLKAQHPELETWAYGKHASMLSCADCHMPLVTTESGTQYHDHHLVSPLNSDILLAKCAACHGSADNTIALVKDIQTKVTARETEVGNKLSALKDELTAAVADGRLSGKELDGVRKLHREAQWFFDFCYVENSEGAHNSALAYRCLDTSDAKIDEARAIIASAGTDDVSDKIPAADRSAEDSDGEEKPAGENVPETEETAAAQAEPVEYRAVKENAFSKVTVIACARDGKLISVEILSEGEDGKDLLTDEIKTEWAKAILESGSASPDAITGATLTFSAGSVQEAMTEILDQMTAQ